MLKSGLVVHMGLLLLVSMLLYAAGQPIVAEDTWWHLGMGAAYASSGPWLETDPFLFTAAGPPAPAAWLADLLFHGIERVLGFIGLRAFHVLCVAVILAAAWRILVRISTSPNFASLCTSAFVALSAYRLFQLRPHLFTILATLLVVHQVAQLCARPAARKPIWQLGLLFALWANLHGGFVIGLLLLGAAVAGTLASAAWQTQWRAKQLALARSLALGLAAATAGSLLNPAGPAPHVLYFAAGGETPSLSVVADEWAAFDLFSLPSLIAPPSPLNWALIPAILFLFALSALRWVRARQRDASLDPIDPALLAMGLAACVGLLAAVRLSWLGLFPLLFVGRTATAVQPTWRHAVLGLALVCSFPLIGDWRWISQGISLRSYVAPYPASKFQAHATWFLADAELEGRLWTDYRYGNFFGYWLAPRMKVFVNGSLNVPSAVMQANRAIRLGTGVGAESLSDLLDQHEIDVFVGTGLPALGTSRRPQVATTAHLERTPGWIRVFRSISNAVYLRDTPRNGDNLRRVEAYYDKAGVPFDPNQGFDPESVSRAAPRWSVAHAVAPADLAGLEQAQSSVDPLRRAWAAERQATILTLLGAYASAIRIDAPRLASDAAALFAARRLVFAHLHLDQPREALTAADQLEKLMSESDALSRALIDTARAGPDRRERLMTLPLFTPAQLEHALRGFQPPQARTRNDLARDLARG